MSEKFDAIIVGAGVSGLSAAYIMSKAGLKVIVIEKGQHPGSKNVMGGVTLPSYDGRNHSRFLEGCPYRTPQLLNKTCG